MAPRNDGAQQQWRFLDSGGGYYRLQSRLSGKVLDVLDFSTANGGEVVQFEDRNGTNQQWRVTESGGYATLVNRNSSKALEVQGASTADAANVVQYDSWGGGGPTSSGSSSPWTRRAERAPVVVLLELQRRARRPEAGRHPTRAWPSRTSR